jgi:hypothetical protein
MILYATEKYTLQIVIIQLVPDNLVKLSYGSKHLLFFTHLIRSPCHPWMLEWCQNQQ